MPRHSPCALSNLTDQTSNPPRHTTTTHPTTLKELARLLGLPNKTIQHTWLFCARETFCLVIPIFRRAMLSISHALHPIGISLPKPRTHHTRHSKEQSGRRSLSFLKLLGITALFPDTFVGLRSAASKLVEQKGFEPMTPGLQSRCSTN